MERVLVLCLGPGLEATMTNTVSAPQPLRCAIYTRKSTEEGLNQPFNSLEAQREAAEAYILSQRHAGWSMVPEHYDDGGFTGGNLDRPAPKQLLADIHAGRAELALEYNVVAPLQALPHLAP